MKVTLDQTEITAAVEEYVRQKLDVYSTTVMDGTYFNCTDAAEGKEIEDMVLEAVIGVDLGEASENEPTED